MRRFRAVIPGFSSRNAPPAPLIRKSLCVNVGQALSPANPALVPILSRLLS
jgi:hypothetical protein